MAQAVLQRLSRILEIIVPLASSDESSPFLVNDADHVVKGRVYILHGPSTCKRTLHGHMKGVRQIQPLHRLGYRLPRLKDSLIDAPISTALGAVKLSATARTRLKYRSTHRRGPIVSSGSHHRRLIA
jgi:hypothetical protein